jgi:hypothetical protein
MYKLMLNTTFTKLMLWLKYLLLFKKLAAQPPNHQETREGEREGVLRPAFDGRSFASFAAAAGDGRSLARLPPPPAADLTCGCSLR